MATKEIVTMMMILLSSGKVELFKKGRFVVLAGEFPNFQSVVALIVESPPETSSVVISAVDGLVSFQGSIFLLMRHLKLFKLFESFPSVA